MEAICQEVNIMEKYCILDENNIKKENTYAISEISPFDIGIPLLDSSDKTIDEVYYYRWHNFCSHIKNTPLGYIVTEFTPSVPWEGIYGSIVCPAGHHMYEALLAHPAVTIPEELSVPSPSTVRCESPIIEPEKLRCPPTILAGLYVKSALAAVSTPSTKTVSPVIVPA